MIARAPGSVKHKSSSLSEPLVEEGLRPVQPPLRNGSVGSGDQLHQMPVRIVEIDASAAIEMVDLARLLATEIRVMLDAGGADTGECRVKLLFADQEGEVTWVEVGELEKSRVTPLSVLTGTKWPHSGPASRFKISARNLADAHLSFAGMIVWFSSTVISALLVRSFYCTRSASRDRWCAGSPNMCSMTMQRRK